MRVAEHREPLVIDDEHIYGGQVLEQHHVAPFGASDAEHVEQPQQTHGIGAAGIQPAYSRQNGHRFLRQYRQLFLFQSGQPFLATPSIPA